MVVRGIVFIRFPFLLAVAFDRSCDGGTCGGSRGGAGYPGFVAFLEVWRKMCQAFKSISKIYSFLDATFVRRFENDVPGLGKRKVQDSCFVFLVDFRFLGGGPSGLLDEAKLPRNLCLDGFGVVLKNIFLFAAYDTTTSQHPSCVMV